MLVILVFWRRRMWFKGGQFFFKGLGVLSVNSIFLRGVFEIMERFGNFFQKLVEFSQSDIQHDFLNSY